MHLKVCILTMSCRYGFLEKVVRFNLICLRMFLLQIRSVFFFFFLLRLHSALRSSLLLLTMASNLSYPICDMVRQRDPEERGQEERESSRIFSSQWDVWNVGVHTSAHLDVIEFFPFRLRTTFEVKQIAECLKLTEMAENLLAVSCLKVFCLRLKDFGAFAIRPSDAFVISASGIRFFPH